jgi:hypothetical protein
VSTFRVEGSSGGVFSWSAAWDDQTKALTIDAAGSGRCTVTVAQSNGQMRTIAFVQNSGDAPLPSAPGLPAPALTILVGDGPTVVPNLNLKPTVSVKDGSGGFEVINEAWARV